MRTEMSFLLDKRLGTEGEADGATSAVEPVVMPRLHRVAYFRTGEVVGAGTYTCTYCGHQITLSRERALPLCGSCDTDEFMASRPVAPTRPRHRCLVAA